MDFGSVKVYVVAASNRVKCKEHGIITEAVSWAHHNSRFTKEMENQIAYLALNMNKTVVKNLMNIAWNTVGPILSRVKNRVEPDSRARYKNLRRIGIEETSYKKGHKYLTVVTDHDTNQVIWVHEGYGTNVLSIFFEELTDEERASIEVVSADSAKWIKDCIDKYLPKAERCNAASHVVSWVIEALKQ